MEVCELTLSYSFLTKHDFQRMITGLRGCSLTLQHVRLGQQSLSYHIISLSCGSVGR